MTETQTTTELDFSKIGMTEGQLKKLSERPRLPDGTVSRFIISNPQGRVLRNGVSVIDMQAVPLQDPSDANSCDARRSVYHKVELPTTDMSPESMDKVMGRARGFLQAIGIEAGPKLPTYNKETKKFTAADGSAVTGPEYEALKNESQTAVVRELVSLAKNPEQLRNLAFYAHIKHNGEFVNINRLKATLPMDGEYWTETAGEEIPF
jgi:hypothetical protein